GVARRLQVKAIAQKDGDAFKEDGEQQPVDENLAKAQGGAVGEEKAIHGVGLYVSYKRAAHEVSAAAKPLTACAALYALLLPVWRHAGREHEGALDGNFDEAHLVGVLR